MGKVGRPVIPITDEMIEKAEALSSRGLTMEQIADSLGLGARTLYEKEQAFPQLAQAIKAGRAKGISVIANALYECGKAGNITAQIFYLKCRAKWKEAENEVDESDNLEKAMLEVTTLKAAKDAKSSQTKS
jgi:hypothetical protein